MGANGTGKSTLMKILAGSETLDYGSITIAKGITAGYLPQDGLTLYRAHRLCGMHVGLRRTARHGTARWKHLTRRMSELDHESPEYTQVAERYHRIEHEFQHTRWLRHRGARSAQC